MRLRSLLYVPAHSERFIAKAHERGADALILDLEDSVPETKKDGARHNLLSSIKSVTRNGAPAFVRVNSGARQINDALAACRAGAYGLVIPKASNPAALTSLAGTLRAEEASLGRPAMPFSVTIEDPVGVLDARAIARVDRVIALSLGSEDFSTAIGAIPTPDVLRHPKLMVHYAAKAEGKLSLGLLRSIADYSDLNAIADSVAEARAHGFDGATCVHPSAVPILNTGFEPSDAQKTWAKRVLEGAQNRPGAFELDGQMIDLPVVERARKILGV